MRSGLLLALAAISFLAAMLPGGGCKRAEKSDPPTVVLYVSVDEPYAAPIIRDFERASGIRVLMKTDAEGSKTAGLAHLLEAEKASPNADVWWNNEPFYAVNLASRGVLASYEPPGATWVASQYRDPQNRWVGLSLRLRVIAVGSGVRDLPAIESLRDLLDPRLKGRITMARPTAGTTGGHVAALFEAWGDEAARRFFADLKANGVRVVGSNSQVAREVASGAMWAGLTDNDDVALAVAGGAAMYMSMPDQQTHGTLAMPTTVAMVAGCKRPEHARRLIDYLLTREVEKRLIDSRFSMHSVAADSTHLVKTMQVDYSRTAARMPEAIRTVVEILEGR